jgi:hypothetical protein
MAGPNRIVLKATRLSNRPDEARGAAAVKPGHLIRHNVNGQVVPHDVAGGFGEIMVAIEDNFQGKTTADAYASGDLVFFHRAVPGDELYLVLAASQVTQIGAYLASNGDGAVKVAGGATDIGLFMAIENAITAGSTGFVRARVLAGAAPGGTANTTTTTTSSTTTTTTTTP